MVEQTNCSVTHPQIVHGTCPHCGLPVAIGQTALEPGTAAPGLSWNLARMLEDLERDDETTRLTTIHNLSDQLPPLNEALPVVRKAFNDRAERVRDRALTACVRLVDGTQRTSRWRRANPCYGKISPISRHCMCSSTSIAVSMAVRIRTASRSTR